MLPKQRIRHAEIERELVAYRDDVFRYLMHLTEGNKEWASDLLQETCVVALEKSHTMRDPGKFKVWLLSVARNLFRQGCRRKKLARDYVRATEPASNSSDMLQGDVDGLYLSGFVAAAIAELPNGQREALYLREIRQCEYTEIAELLGISMDAVKNRLHVARGHLRNVISQHERAIDVRSALK